MPRALRFRPRHPELKRSPRRQPWASRYLGVDQLPVLHPAAVAGPRAYARVRWRHRHPTPSTRAASARDRRRQLLPTAVQRAAEFTASGRATQHTDVDQRTIGTPEAVARRRDQRDQGRVNIQEPLGKVWQPPLWVNRPRSPSVKRFTHPCSQRLNGNIPPSGRQQNPKSRARQRASFNIPYVAYLSLRVSFLLGEVVGPTVEFVGSSIRRGTRRNWLQREPDAFHHGLLRLSNPSRQIHSP